MIRRSEKRRLIGPEASGAQSNSLSTHSQAAAEALPTPHGVFAPRTEYELGCSRAKFCATVGEPFLSMPTSKRETWQLRINFLWAR